MYTAYDAIEYLMSSTGGGAQDREHRVLRQRLEMAPDLGRPIRPRR
jgi:hypothetical protein